MKFISFSVEEGAKTTIIGPLQKKLDGLADFFSSSEHDVIMCSRLYGLLKSKVMLRSGLLFQCITHLLRGLLLLWDLLLPELLLWGPCRPWLD